MLTTKGGVSIFSFASSGINITSAVIITNPARILFSGSFLSAILSCFQLDGNYFCGIDYQQQC